MDSCACEVFKHWFEMAERPVSAPDVAGAHLWLRNTMVLSRYPGFGNTNPAHTCADSCPASASSRSSPLISTLQRDAGITGMVTSEARQLIPSSHVLASAVRTESHQFISICAQHDTSESCELSGIVEVLAETACAVDSGRPRVTEFVA